MDFRKFRELLIHYKNYKTKENLDKILMFYLEYGECTAEDMKNLRNYCQTNLDYLIDKLDDIIYEIIYGNEPPDLDDLE